MISQQMEHASDLYNRGRILQSGLQYSKAIQSYESCLELNPNFLPALLNLGCIYSGDFDDNSNSGLYDVHYYADIAKAIKCFKKCIQVDPHSSHLYVRLAQLNLSLNSTDAIQNFNNYLHLNPNNPNVIEQLGLACQHFKRNQDAVIHFKKCIEIDKNNSKAHRQLGISYGELQKFEEAIKSFKKCVSINNGDSQALACLGRTYNKMGKIEEAIRYYKQCNYLRHGNAEAKQYLIKHGVKDVKP